MSIPTQAEFDFWRSVSHHLGTIASEFQKQTELLKEIKESVSKLASKEEK